MGKLLAPLKRSQSRTTLLVVLALTLSNLGCTNLFYYPSSTQFPVEPTQLARRQDYWFSSQDGTRLHAWHFPAEPSRCTKPKALIIHYHGNAQNLSTHFRFFSWMADDCFDYYIFDYRSYGQSQGRLSHSGILLDARSALRHFDGLAREKSVPLVGIGQSLGGTLLLRSLQLDGRPETLRALIIESSFYRYSQIAQEKLSILWITWPFQWLARLLVSDSASPGDRGFEKLRGIPSLLIYSENDLVVPIHHGRQLFEELPEPKWFWAHPEPGHVNAMFIRQGGLRQKLVDWLDWQLQ